VSIYHFLLSFIYLAKQAHNKWYQSRVPATMAEGTRYAQLADSVAANRQETSQLAATIAANRQETASHSELLKTVLEKLGNLSNFVNTLVANSQNQNPIQNSVAQGTPNRENNGEKNKESQGEKSRENQGETSGVPKTEQSGYIEGGVHTRLVKLDFPRFDGSEPINWILKAQQFYSYNQTPEHQKVSIAAFHMEGRALPWYHWLMDAGYVGGWEDFVSALKTRFAPSTFDDPVGAFTKLKQFSTAEDYQTQFEILSNKIQGLSEEFKVSSFLSGLK